MRRFTRLFIEMDRTKRTSEKLAALVRYFRAAPPQDAAWALYFLSGRKIKRLIPSNLLHEALLARTGLPDWLVSESYEAVGDYAELVALLWPSSLVASGDSLPLHGLVNERMLALRTIADLRRQAALITQTWDELDFDERFVFNKLLTGNFRVGVAQTLIIRALASVANVPTAVMAHRFAGKWDPTGDSFTRLVATNAAADFDSAAAPALDPAQPYPFCLGYPIEQPPEELGPIDQWQAEWKYDGIRAQLIRRANEILIWSRGDELITPAFPEIARAAERLPPDTVLDGEIVAWENDHPLPFALLQRRINRKQFEEGLWTDVPVAFLAFDVIEHEGQHVRAQPLHARRASLEQIIAPTQTVNAPIQVSPIITFASWAHLAQLRETAREKHVEGVMLKRRDGTYRVGRRKGDWWKWKIEPYTVDAVLIYAQGGSGRRAGVFTDYTFGVWDQPDGATGAKELVPVAKAYSGLTDEEVREVDRFIRRNTLAKHGPVRVVKPELVFELAFEGIAESTRHKAGLALRFPRMHRWRTDKKAEDADTLESLRALLKRAQTFHE